MVTDNRSCVARPWSAQTKHFCGQPSEGEAPSGQLSHNSVTIAHSFSTSVHLGDPCEVKWCLILSLMGLASRNLKSYCYCVSVMSVSAVPGSMTRTEHCSLSRGKPLALCGSLDSSCQPCNLSQNHVAWAKPRPKTSRLCLLHLQWNSPPTDHNTVWRWRFS